MAKQPTGPAIDPGAIYTVDVLRRVTVAGGIKLKAGDRPQLLGAAVIEAGDAVDAGNAVKIADAE